MTTRSLTAVRRAVDAERERFPHDLDARQCVSEVAQTKDDPFTESSAQLAEQLFSERFWSRVDRSDVDGCWLWTGARNRYGNVFFRGTTWKTHRVAYEIAVGPIPKGMCVCHRCDRPLCVRPDHLWLGTHADNSYDMVMKGRSVGMGKRERPFMRNTHMPLTEPQAAVLRFIKTYFEAHGITPSYRRIGKEFGWSSTNSVSDVIKALRRKGALGQKEAA